MVQGVTTAVRVTPSDLDTVLPSTPSKKGMYEVIPAKSLDGVLYGDRTDKDGFFRSRSRAHAAAWTVLSAIAFGLVLGLGARYGNRTCMLCSIIPGFALAYTATDLFCICVKGARRQKGHEELEEEVTNSDRI